MQPQAELMPHHEVGTRHESSEVSARGILIFASGLVVLGVVIHLVLAFVMQRYSSQESRIRALRPPRFAAPADFPAPRLQGDPAADRLRYQEQELRQLNTYGWVDHDAGIAHIPIERALDILAESGLPPRGGAPQSGSEAAARPEPERPAQPGGGSQPNPGKKP